MRIEQHGGPGVDDVEGFDHMLLLALRIGRPTSDIFEIDLPSGHRRWTLQRLMVQMEDKTHRNGETYVPIYRGETYVPVCQYQ